MSETSPTTRATRTKTAETSVSDELLARVVELTEARIASRPNPMALNSFDEVIAFAERACRTQMVPKDYVGKPDNIILAIMQGKELGLPPIMAIQSIAMVNGRPALWGDAVQGLCYARNVVEDHAETFEGTEGQDDFTAVCTVKRKGIASPKVGRFSQSDAKRAGLYGQAIHGKYPRQMMVWRARHQAFHAAFPDILKGIGTFELDREDAVATPGWTMPQPEKGWFTHKPLTQSDGWDDTWFSGIVQKLAGEPNAWKWMDLLIASIDGAPTLRDVNEIGDLPQVKTVRDTAPDEAKAIIDKAFADGVAWFAKPAAKEDPKPTSPVAKTVPSVPATQSVWDGDDANGTEPERTGPPLDLAPPATSGSRTTEWLEAWLVDGEGNEIPDEDGVVAAFTDPVAYAQAYIDARATFPPETLALFDRANHDSLRQAMRFSTEVSAILATKPAPVTAPDDDAPSLPMEMPVDPWTVPAPPANARSSDYQKYHEAFDVLRKTADTPEKIGLLIDRNEPTYTRQGFAPSRRTAIKALIEAQQRAISPPSARDAAPVVATPLDIAHKLMHEIRALDTAEAVVTWRKMPAIEGAMAALKVEAPNLFDQVTKLADARRATFMAETIKQKMRDCKTDAELKGLPNDPEFLRQCNEINSADPNLFTEIKELRETLRKELAG